MKIAQVVCVYPPYKGGIGNACYYNSQELKKSGHEVVVFTPQYSWMKFLLSLFKKKEKGVKRIFSFFKFGNAAFVPQLFWHLRKFDVIHLHYPFFGGAEVVWLGKIFRIISAKLIITYHMDVIPEKNWKGKIFIFSNHFLLHRILKSADKVLVSSFDYADNSNIKEFLQKNPNKFIELPFGILIDKFKPGSNKAEIIQKLEIKNILTDDKIILFVGGLDSAHYFKGVDFLIRSFARLAKRNENLKLLIVGEGDKRFSYESLAYKLGLRDKVIFCGRVSDDELPCYYNLSNIFVLPSLNGAEAFGIVLLEAMASGLPVIASNLPGVRTLIKNGENGFTFTPQNDLEFREKINFLLKDNSLARKMGESGRKIVEKKYLWAEVGKKLEEVISKL